MHQRKQNHKKSRSPIPLLFRQIRTFFRRATRGLMRSLLGRMKWMDRRDRRRVAGFVLPTVTMVLLVVVLLSVAILFRSMERAKYAQYSKVDEATLQAATPALQRAKSKLQALFNDPTLPTRGTPTESALYTALSREEAYRLPDEVALAVQYDIDGDGSISEPESTTPLEDQEKIQTAWKFPIDTDNNGKFDTWTLYGIYFRSPSRDTDGNFDRERKPLDARTPPRSATEALNSECAALGVGTLVGDLGWYSAGSNLKKSFFTYVANVPITDADLNTLNSVYDSNDFEERGGSTGFSALEYQQDLLRIPLNNSAVVYRDDLGLAPGGGLPFRLNGRIITNSNLIVTQFSGLDFYLVSAPASCYYNEENSKILVGGNLISGAVGGNADGNNVGAHLFQGAGTAPDTGEEITSGNDSTGTAVLSAMDNALAFETRLDDLVDEAINNTPGKNALKDYFEIEDDTQLENAVRTYFEDRTRRVPFVDGLGNTGLTLQGSLADENLRPQDDYIFPTPVNGTVDTGGTVNGVTLERTRPPAQDPETVDTEPEIGNRILMGNALPAVWYNNGVAVGEGEKQELEGVTWTDSATTRTRETRVQELPDVGATGRDGFWERAAGIEPTTPFDNVGGLRVVTGAGVYDRVNSFLPPPKLDLSDDGSKVVVGTYDDPDTSDEEEYIIVWPDTMPMSLPSTAKAFNNDGLYDATTFAPVDNPTDDAGAGVRWLEPDDTDYPTQGKGDLQMRATAVYHYAADDDSNYSKEDEADQSAANYWSKVTQTPIACVSSYYDPSTSLTAKNENGLGWNDNQNGQSNNGIVYGPPTTTSEGIGQLTAGGNGLLGGGSELAAQANMVFPNGRFANETLRNALQKAPANRTLSEQSAIDSTLCALGILDGSLSTTSIGLPDGAIYETSFLNGRDIKQNEVNDPATGNEYNLPIEYRQPLEIRATVLDIEQLRTSTLPQSTTGGPSDGGDEYYLPFSGIIFASRDDALPDRTDPDSAFVSATDFALDSTRRPNGIMLVNGRCLQRDEGGSCQPNNPTEESITQEKGLTLVSNLPVYVKGEFNLHTQEEFDETLDDDWGNFYDRATINTNFACRAGDPRINGCNEGDDWRVANILSDATTVLSGDVDDQSTGFRFGYRNEGDFDLNNNAGDTQIGYDQDGDGSISTTEYNMTADDVREKNGFHKNYFAINALTSGSDFDTDGSGTVATYTDADYQGTAGLNSSYFNNFVTPVQRRSDFPDYIMEYCRKPLIEACGPTDWVVGFDFSGLEYKDGGTRIANIEGKTITLTYPDGSTQDKSQEDLTMYDIAVVIPSGKATVDGNQLKIQFFSWKGMQDSFQQGSGGVSFASRLMGGTTGLSLDPEYQRFPRRISFLRDQNGGLLVNTSGNPVAIGVSPKQAGKSGDNSKNQDEQHDSLDCFVSGGGITLNAATVGYDVPAATGNSQHSCGDYTDRGPRLRTSENALWFKTQNSSAANYGYNYPLWFYDPANTGTPKTYTAGTTENPLVVPVLQLDATTTEAGATKATAAGGTQADNGTSWIAPAAGDTTFNFVVATGDTPSRPLPSNPNRGEFNGGLPNLVRLNENWKDLNVTIFGSFIQAQRSEYSTAPQFAWLNAAPKAFGGNTYNTSSNQGKAPFFSQPGRNWGFDVGLLSQSPDLFTSKLTNAPSEDEPDEFFREVNRNDKWIQTLLCAKETDSVPDPNDPTAPPTVTTNNAVGGSDRPTTFCEDYTE